MVIAQKLHLLIPYLWFLPSVYIQLKTCAVDQHLNTENPDKLFLKENVCRKLDKPSVTGWSLEDLSESGECSGSGSFKLSKCIKGS